MWIAILLLTACSSNDHDAGADAAAPQPDAAPASDAGTAFPRFPQAIVEALHTPLPTARPDRALDADRLQLRLNGAVLPAIDGYKHDGTQDPEGRAWLAPATGALAFSVRRGDAATVEVASHSRQGGPVVLDEPLISSTPYSEYGLWPFWGVIVGKPGAYTMKTIPLNYNPTAAEKWRLSVINSYTDEAISGRLVEMTLPTTGDGAPAVVPNGRTITVFEHVPARGTVENLEIVSPRFGVGLQIWIDRLGPSQPSMANTVAQSYLSGWGDVPGFLPFPDGSILQVAVGQGDNDHHDALGFAERVQAWVCRDPRFKQIAIDHSQGDPHVCWGPVWGPGVGADGPTQAASSPTAAPSTFCRSNLTGAGCELAQR